MSLVSKYKCDDAGSTCSESSVDTNEALSEMLGLPPASSFDGLLSAATEEVEHLPDYGDCVDDDVESATTTTTAIVERHRFSLHRGGPHTDDRGATHAVKLIVHLKPRSSSLAMRSSVSFLLPSFSACFSECLTSAQN